ncbi:PREDICTED: uncharacterized protein LOC108760291 isoform X2 [Trachymyrmex cornetzi]|uniref:uncharacterized protein LOC108760291 isoform X2 n=1 Tax=Trachymyrmex cornetzi TaxID=471704 RepID=UPI00084F0619|nr:PREDICTED: uncharacterized protein LOC108760291 isoform X2 [Trachymyrmex cornetzi]
MEIAGDAKNVAKNVVRPLTIAIPSKQGVVLMSHDTPSSTHSQSKMPLCPAYRFCRELEGPYRSPMFDSDYDHQQQITILHDLLQAIKEAALKLIQLITIEERRRRGVDPPPRIRYPDSGRYERSTQPHNPESGLIVTTSSSVCALCGVALHLQDSSEKSRQFVIDKGRSNGYSHGISPKQLENMLKKTYKIPLPTEKDKYSDDFSIPGSVLDYILSKENGRNDRTKGREKVFSKARSTDTSESGLQSKLLFIRRKSSDRIARQTHQDESRQRCDSTSQVPRYVTSKHEYKTSESSHQCIVNISSTICSTQEAATLTQEMLCPCACGLLVKEETESKVSINPMPILKDELIKTKLEELGLHLDSREIKVHGDTVKVKKTKMQKLEKDVNVKRWIEEVVQLRLQVQIEELHKNIQFFKQENEYIRRLAEKCRCLSEDIRNLQQLLPIRETYSEFATTIKHLQAKYHNQHGIIATLTGMFQGSINIQQIAAKLLAPFKEHWNPRENIATTHISSASGAQAPLKTASSMVFDVY